MCSSVVPLPAPKKQMTPTPNKKPTENPKQKKDPPPPKIARTELPDLVESTDSDSSEEYRIRQPVKTKKQSKPKTKQKSSKLPQIAKVDRPKPKANMNKKKVPVEIVKQIVEEVKAVKEVKEVEQDEPMDLYDVKQNVNTAPPKRRPTNFALSMDFQDVQFDMSYFSGSRRESQASTLPKGGNHCTRCCLQCMSCM